MDADNAAFHCHELHIRPIVPLFYFYDISSITSCRFVNIQWAYIRSRLNCYINTVTYRPIYRPLSKTAEAYLDDCFRDIYFTITQA